MSLVAPALLRQYVFLKSLFPEIVRIPVKAEGPILRIQVPIRQETGLNVLPFKAKTAQGEVGGIVLPIKRRAREINPTTTRAGEIRPIKRKTIEICAKKRRTGRRRPMKRADKAAQ